MKSKSRLAKVCIELLSVICLLLLSFGSVAETQQECEAKIVAAQGAGIILDMSAKAGGIHVMVNVDTWESMPFSAKLNMASIIECAIVDKGERLSALIFRDHRANKVIGRYRYPDLVVE